MNKTFEIPKQLIHRDFVKEFEATFASHVNPVNHGEFETAVEQLLEQAKLYEASPNGRAAALAIQRCRRGGKTFMLHAVAALLSERLPKDTHIIFISMGSRSKFEQKSENAHDAICSRVAWEISGRPGTFRVFKHKYQDFGAVDEWLTASGTKAILLVDELNMISHTLPKYGDMRSLLNIFIQQVGCSLLYSTHHRSTKDLLRGRVPGCQSLVLPKNDHFWMSIPRILNEGCLLGLHKNASYQPAFWSAVLRGRVPALVLQRQDDITNYAEDVYLDPTKEEERKAFLTAVITGDINSLPNAPSLFRAYSYMSQRFFTGNEPRFAWPPFMVAQYGILRKDYKTLRLALENPEIDEPKAFEALIQLSVLVRLLSEQYHALVPRNPNSTQDSDFSAFDAAEMLHVSEKATTLPDIVGQVRARYSQSPKVTQVVAVPSFASFPVYDFFLLHRKDGEWNVAVGYQCKQGIDYPSEDAWTEVPKSVWVEGSCRKYRTVQSGGWVKEKVDREWVMVAKSNQVDFLGVSVSEALPQDPIEESSTSRACKAEISCGASQEATLLESDSKKARTS